MSCEREVSVPPFAKECRYTVIQRRKNELVIIGLPELVAQNDLTLNYTGRYHEPNGEIRHTLAL
jgi:hypothetical protein